MKKITFGWRIPAFPVNGTRGTEFFDQIMHSLERVEESFDCAWLCDHMIPWADWQKPDTDNLECLTAISYLMGIFQHLSFGSIVLCNSYRNPALLAKMVAILSRLAPGRFILGIGAGYKKDEYLSYGFDFPKASTRIEMLEEAVQIIRKMWTEKVVYFHGKHYNVYGAYCYPKPDPVPPIMIGGGGEKRTLRVVAIHADWWNCYSHMEEYRRKLNVLKHHCENVGRNYEAIKKTWLGCIAIAETKGEAAQIARKNPFSSETETILGTPKQVVKRLEDFIDIGVEHFILRFLDFPKTMGIELFAKEVADKIG